ncbi:NMDA receptor synaptonuclear signaling and neuronal migration factor [Channa argus]|uniref:NMDA receptor synaptonuclear signaling and neuronal migration factor n=1 Tax=Channa argus TaxID=215402 RepID=A0A6G1QI90_CHAAH|nr:NMDA receptor synaptonuclear signaling and neuronal migration factor [Channa argus]
MIPLFINLAHLLSETLVGPDPESPSDIVGPNKNNNFHHSTNTTKSPKEIPEPNLVKEPLGILQPPPPSITVSTKPARLSLERSFSAEEDQQKCVECTLQPARVYTITTQHGMLMSSGRESKESLELDVLKEKSGSGGAGSRGSLIQPSTSPSSTSSSPTQYHHASSGRGTSSCGGSHHHSNHHHSNHHHHHAPPSSGGTSGASAGSSSNQQQAVNVTVGLHSHHAPQHSHHHHHLSQPPLQSSVSAHNIRGWGEGGKGEAECSRLACDSCSGAPSRSQGSLDLESTSREAGKQHRRLERMWSVDRVTGLEREDTNWFPKENMFTFQTATTTMQANFRKHLRMVGSRRIKAQSGDLQTPCGTMDEGGVDDNIDWEEEREMERLACEGDDFIPPKIMLISSKVPKAEYVPNIIRRDDPSIIPILYDHEHATFDDILEEIEKKLTAYRKGSKFWRMLIFCQGGPGHLYLLKNKVATFAKVEKEEDMSQFWRRLSRFMSKINPEPNIIHIMGCYVLGNPNGEKLFQKLKNLMRPYSVEFESPLELSAQGKEMIEMYFDFRLYRLWKTRQHSKLLDYEDFL